MRGTCVMQNAALHKCRDPRGCVPVPGTAHVSTLLAAPPTRLRLWAAPSMGLSRPCDGREMPFRREVHVFSLSIFSLHGARASEESAFMPCAQRFCSA